MVAASPANEDTVLAWNTVLFDKFVRFRRQLTDGLGAHGAFALERCPPPVGARVLDIGCGFGDTTLQLARMVGPEGEAVGIDAAERFVEVGAAEAAAQGLRHVRFIAGDVETAALGGPYDYAFARFGTMFFANPVAAFRNVRRALRPGATLCIVVWRAKHHNAWASEPEAAVLELLGHPPEDDQVTCGPGPFSMASADVTSDVLLAAGFSEIGFRRSDAQFKIGDNVQDAIEFAIALGPAGEVVRLWGEAGARRLDEVRAAGAAVVQPYATPDGVRMASSTWMVTARAG